MALESTLAIRKRLHGLAARERALTVYAGAARLIISFLVFAVVFILMDWLLSMPKVMRLILLLGGVGGIIWIGKTYLYDPLKILMNEEAVALRLESRFPHLQDRLISVVQLTRSEDDLTHTGMSAALVRRLEKDTAELTTSLNFSEIIDWGFIRKVTMICAGLVLASVVSASRFPTYVTTGLARMALGSRSYPRLTQVELLEPEGRAVRGDDWTLRVGVSGRIPFTVVLYTRPTEGRRRWEEAEMLPELGRTYAATVEKVYESFEFMVEAGDALTTPERVTVLVPVALEDPVVTVTPPAYTSLDPIREVSLQEVEVPERSEVEFFISATKKVVSGQILPEDADPIDLRPLASGNGASGRTVVVDSMSFLVSVVDNDGLANPEPRALYRLKVRPDQPPKAVIVSPGEDRTSVPIAEWSIRYRLSDDFGVKKAWLTWRVDKPLEGNGEETPDETDGAKPPPVSTGREEIAVPSGDGPGSVKLSMLSKRVTVGDILTVWIEAADALAGAPDEASGDRPHVGKSPSVRFRIIDEDEKWAEIDAKMKDAEKEIIEIYDDEKKLKGRLDRTKEILERKKP
ncbi:DUF4175 family protein [Planctomycetota bacterium]